MNEFERLRQLSKRYKESYPPGTRIYLNEMDDPYTPVPSGTRGTVVMVDDIGTIHMKWDNGSSLGVVPGVDSFRKLTAKELEEEQQSKKPGLDSQISNAFSRTGPSANIAEKENQR